ncbi:hypothetical protein [Thermohalobacter berrensis]|uniref:Uncharacterized protein n=1 Tax=Thermohalobacter berrensis TaxID=99594 RepID=A0A419T6U2_9FIRM|nr:hypothetical protein [Thermohalobacter berrensis]RKD33162.1 hypothetical protein BET03_09595 [Thermohalobacter berrensis]
MKKIILIMMIFILVFTVACNNETIENNNTNSDNQNSELQEEKENEEKPNEEKQSDKERETIEISEIDFTKLDKPLNYYNQDMKVSPDGNFVAFSCFSASDDNGKMKNLLVRASLVTGKVTILTESEKSIRLLDWSKDGKRILYRLGQDLYVYNVYMEKNTISKIDDRVFSASFSPKSNKIAYSRDDGIWIYNFNDNSKQQLTEGKYDYYPLWYPDESHLLFFKDLGENLGDGAGNGQGIYIYSFKDNKEIKILSYKDNKELPKKYRKSQWISPGKLVHIVSGWDDGWYEHILNLETQEMIDLGERFLGGGGPFITDINKEDRMIVKLDNSEAEIFGKGMDSKIKSFESKYNIIELEAVGNNSFIYLEGELYPDQFSEIEGVRLIYDENNDKKMIEDFGDFSGLEFIEQNNILIYFENENNNGMTKILKLKIKKLE